MFDHAYWFRAKQVKIKTTGTKNVIAIVVVIVVVHVVVVVRAVRSHLGYVFLSVIPQVAASCNIVRFYYRARQYSNPGEDVVLCSATSI